MDKYFDKIMEFIFRWEGGYVNDPDDPGKETNFGISKKAHPDVDIKNLTKEEAKEIYRKKYWDPLVDWDINTRYGRIEERKYSLCGIWMYYDFIMFRMDTAVNMGFGFAIKLNGSVNCMFVDRIKRYTRIAKHKRMRKYFRGWINRVCDLHDFIEEVMGEK